MGNYDFGAVGGNGKGKDDVRFLQSRSDFPLTLRLGRKTPRWGMSRLAGDGGLVFTPADDERYRVCGDGNRLEYRGRRRSHRFTILKDDAFEYDCILLREPESNIITLHMDGAERYDFFRQPDFIKDPLLAGSYAVYKKNTLLGEGTGKLCHIHRPEIVDAGGRRCWGDLAVSGNRLEIIVPERFLSDAAYPVVVDPVVGTTTVGSQRYWFDEWNEGDYVPLELWYSLATNRFTLPETLNGRATAFVYAGLPVGRGRLKPVLYSDEGGIPVERLSANEGGIDFEVNAGRPEGWRSAMFDVTRSVAGGSHIWLALFCDSFYPRFDFGQKCYWHHWFWLGDEIQDVYPMYAPEFYYDFKLSMYFTYTVPRNHQRTVTQGVTLGDLRKPALDYGRKVIQAVGVETRSGRVAEFFIKTLQGVGVETRNGKIADYVKNIIDTTNGIDNKYFRMFATRLLTGAARAMETVGSKTAFFRVLADYSKLYCQVILGWIYIRKLLERVQTYGGIRRKLSTVVMIVSKLMPHGLPLGRLFKSRSELFIKSRITKNIVLDSRIK